MKPIMSALIVLLMTFAMVSIGGADWLPGSITNAEGLWSGFLNAGDAYTPSHRNPYPCISFPAYDDYAVAKNGTCPPPAKRIVTPEPMGSVL